MNQPDLLRTIQLQQAEINQLRDQLSRSHAVDFQAKYKKALKEIFGIIKANRQLKEELTRLSSFKSAEGDNLNRIKKEQIEKAYQKILKEKNQLLGQKEALMIQNETLKYSVNTLEDTVNKLKSEKMALARQKQGIAKINALQKSAQNPNDKLRDKDFKQKQSQYRKTLQNYQQRQSSLSKTNRKLEEQISELENKLYNLEAEYKNKLNEKDIEVKVSKFSAREEFQSQITSLKKEVSQLKLNNNQLLIKVNSYSNNIRNENNSSNQYEQNLIEALRDLKLQMEPMSVQIAELQDKNQSEREQVQRQRANLQIKVMEYEAQIERMRENQKMLEQKLLKENDKSRKWEEAERTIRKLEEENQMLGGRVIVLEAKEVTLRNRSGDELEDRVLEFQTRVQMLLSDKETVANMKNVGIHQMIALKAYIMELDAQLKHVVLNYDYAEKKYKSYKQKCSQLIRELKQHDIAINALKGKLQGYDRLVVKLQGELERAITINDNQMKAINVKITESTMNSIEIYKKRYESLVEKLSLQQKYAQQEIQTLKLNYDTKILDLTLKLEELSSIKETIGLYKTKNEELSGKLTQRQNQLLETKMTKIVIADTVPQSKNPLKETINKLHETLNSKQTTILNLQNQVRKTEQEWKAKYNQLQQATSATLSKKNREDDDKKREIDHLENQIRNYRAKINELETVRIPTSRSDEEVDFRKSHHFTGQISDLEVQLEDYKNRYEIECARTAKLNKANIDLKQANNDLEGQATRLKFEIKRIEKEMQLEVDDKNNEIKRLQAKSQQNYLESSRVQKPQAETNNFKLNSLRMELQMLQGQTQQLEKDKTRYYNRSIELEREVSELSIKVEQLNYALERTKNSISNDLLLRQTQKEQEIERLQYNLKSFRDKNIDLEERMAEYQAEITRLRNELNKEKQRFIMESDNREEEISKLARELNRMRADISSKEDMRAGVEQQYEYKINRMANDNMSLRDDLNSLQTQLQRYESEIKFLKDREGQYGRKADSQEDYILKLSNDIKELQNREIEVETQLMERDGVISKLNAELIYLREEITHISQNLESKDAYINKITSEFNITKNNLIEMEIKISSQTGEQNKAISDLLYASKRIEDLEHELSTVNTELNRIKSQALSHETNFNQTVSALQDKDMTIMRLQSDLKTKSELLHDLEFQLSSKTSRISELQNESIRLRSASSDFQSELMQKNAQITRLTYDLNNIKIRYENLEEEHQNNDTNWASMNRELASIRAQIGNYEDDIQMKNITIERQKNDIKELAEQIQRINEEIFEKNKTINSLNQELFRLKIEGDEKSSEQIYKLENEIYMLKSKVNKLEGELETKEEQLSRVRLEISTVRSNITVNRYTDEQYDILQAQFFQAQKSLAETRGAISEKDLEISQLETKVQYLKKVQAETKRRFNQERLDLETQLQNVLTRERELRRRISELESEAILQQNKANDDQKWGIHLYQQQCDRLQNIVQELQEEVNSLKLKMTYMTNQEDRIIENLTLMTLTFAQVQALRDRMKIKENQISEVRKSLINFATSSDEITSMGSRMVVKERINTDKSIQRRDPANSFEEIDKNGFTYKFSQDLYNNNEASKKVVETSIYGENNNRVDTTKQLEAVRTYNANYREEDLEEEISKGNQQDEQNQYAMGQAADRKLNEMMRSLSGKQKQEKSIESSQKQSKNPSGIYEQNQQSQTTQEVPQSFKTQTQQVSQVSQSLDQSGSSGSQQRISAQLITSPQPQPQTLIQSVQPTSVFSQQQPTAFYASPPSNQASWRYGSPQSTHPMSMSVNQQGTQIIQQKQQVQQFKVNIGPAAIPNKPVSPAHQSFSMMPMPPQQMVQFQTMPGPQGVPPRHFGVIPQTLQYPGFAR